MQLTVGGDLWKKIDDASSCGFSLLTGNQQVL